MIQQLKSRLHKNGQLSLLIRKMRKFIGNYPESTYAKAIYRKLILKFFLGSKFLKYQDLFQEAWQKYVTDHNEEVLQIDGVKFVNDHSLSLLFSDIFLSGNVQFGNLLPPDKRIAIEILASLSSEGPYENEYVKISENDVVIDAGANLGVFSLLCLTRKVQKVFAFEPQIYAKTILERNILLNNAKEIIEIVPSGLSDSTNQSRLFHSDMGHTAASIVPGINNNTKFEMIHCVDLDSWVKANNISKIDFIKADIEGSERKMLKGATFTLKYFCPKLAICTYHLPDDPEVIEKIILAANPSYKVFHTSHKLFAIVQ